MPIDAVGYWLSCRGATGLQSLADRLNTKLILLDSSCPAIPPLRSAADFAGRSGKSRIGTHELSRGQDVAGVAHFAAL